MLAIQVAATEFVLQCCNGSSNQLQSAIDTGITPATIYLAAQVTPGVPAPPAVPIYSQPDPAFEIAPYSELDINQTSTALYSQIFLDMSMYNRLRPSARDYLLAYGKALYRQNAFDQRALSMLYLVLTFYPNNPQLLLFFSSVCHSFGRPIVSLFLSRELLEHESKEDRICVEALSNMGVAYLQLVRHSMNGIWLDTDNKDQGRADLAGKCFGKALISKPTHWTAVFNFLHLLVASQEGQVPSDLQQNAIVVCDQVQDRIWPPATGGGIQNTRDGAMPENISLAAQHQAQTFFLCKGRFLGALQRPVAALATFVLGIELILTQRPPDQQESHTPKVSFSELMQALTFHVYWQWADQAGDEGDRYKKKFADAVKMISGGVLHSTDMLDQTIK